MSPIPPVHFTGIVIGPSGFAGEGRQFLGAIEAAEMQPSLSGYSFGSHTCRLPPEEEQLIQRCAARPKRPGGITVHHNLIPHFEPDAHHLQLSMREVVDDPISARRRAIRGRQHVLSLCDPQRISAMLSRHLRHLSHPVRPA